MSFLSILSFTHKLIEERVHPGDTVVDATVGNGVDTLFLAKLAGPHGTVFGFDIQEQALANARARLEKELAGAANGQIHLHCRSHAEMLDAVPAEQHGRVAAVTFNLGYLPGADHAVITTPASTLPALEASLTLLRKGGVVTAVLYSGHEGGQEETSAVMDWATQISQKEYQVMQYQFLNQKHCPPFLVAIAKR